MSNFLVIAYITLLIATQIRARCDDGWISFNMSCYFVERKEKETFWQAKYECEKKGGTIFTPETRSEYKTLMGSTQKFAHTWSDLPASSECVTKLQNSDMDWLVNTPFMPDAANGYNTISQCAAYYNGNVYGAKYMYYYPCDYKFYYICEKEQANKPPCQKKIKTCAIL